MLGESCSQSSSWENYREIVKENCPGIQAIKMEENREVIWRFLLSQPLLPQTEFCMVNTEDEICLNDAICTKDSMILKKRVSSFQDEDEICMNNAICSNESMILKRKVSSFQDEDYAENMKQFQLQVDKIKKLAKPGCSPEILKAALGLISSLFDTLSLITSKRHIRASL